MIYFTSDTHFGSERTLELSRRPFNSVEEMDAKIISNWNQKVNLKDKIYILGDVGNFSKLNDLNGIKIVIFGNYESDVDLIQISDQVKVIPKGLYSFKYNGSICKFYLCHKPVDCDLDHFNLFGHIHALCMVKEFGLNVGMDCHNFYPICITEVLYYKNAIENFYDENVFM